MISNEDVEEFLCKSDVMVFRPTKKEFKNFSKYVEYMEECGAAKWGVAKVTLKLIALLFNRDLHIIEMQLDIFWYPKLLLERL